MKLRNKKTGEIGELHFEPDKEYHFTVATENPADMRIYKNLAELCEEWEDYEEPEVIYYLSWDGVVLHSADKTGWQDAKQIGNYFETKEEAEKAVEKLKAWKRLKDKGFEFESWFGGSKDISFWLDTEIDEDIAKDLDLLFGGEE